MLKLWNLVPYVRKRDSNLVSYPWKLLWWLQTLKNSEAGYKVRVPFQKLHFGTIVSRSHILTSISEIIMTHETETSYLQITHWLYSILRHGYLCREATCFMTCPFIVDKGYAVYGRVTFLFQFSVIMLLWWRNCTTQFCKVTAFVYTYHVAGFLPSKIFTL